jgi:hypothetical protein
MLRAGIKLCIKIFNTHYYIKLSHFSVHPFLSYIFYPFYILCWQILYCFHVYFNAMCSQT